MNEEQHPETPVTPRPRKKSSHTDNIMLIGIVIIAALVIFVQFKIAAISGALSSPINGAAAVVGHGDGIDISGVDVTQIKSTAQGIALLFPMDEIKTSDDAIRVMIPTGTPDYGEAMGVSFDDPVTALKVTAGAYNALNNEIKTNYPEVWARYLNLAAAPRGISCEFCCGVGPQGITAEGRSKCGCKHNPALLTVTLWLMQNTEYSDAEILREVYKWKALYFPKKMVGLASQIAGGDTSVLKDLPSMVGGC